MYHIGEKICEHRQKQGLTQEALAERLNVSRQSVSKWETGQTLPEVDKILAMSRIFATTTDELLYPGTEMPKKRDFLQLGSIYLITKDMPKAINFYEKLLSMRASTRHPQFAEFFFDQHCIALMDAARLPNHNYVDDDHKFVINFNVRDLVEEHRRLKSLQIGKVSDISQAHSEYYFFNIYDVDENVIEINGQVFDTRRNDKMDTIYCQSCAMWLTEDKFGTEKDGTKTSEYCHYCFQKGEFTTPQTFDQAVEGNIPFWLEQCGNDEEKARQKIKEVFATLKRWK
ncbi:MAG: helix-turn-helix domain-containing protein [Defluviitaleaceae bacterium]|nr:helix-turn-helix domain-containing protein [Defluviitaleaceae bacterium]